VTQDVSRYKRYYYERDIPENWFHNAGLLRPDQLAAIAYAMNWPFFGDEKYRTDTRHPGRIMSIGAGRGDTDYELERMGFEVVGVDPSPGAREVYRGSTLLDAPDNVEECGTVLFVESLEHLPVELISDLWQRFSRGTRVVIVNWPAFHPIAADPGGWDHITNVDDDLFDSLSSGFHVVQRNGSHLVIDR
jgi:hypothetical protein